MRIWVDNISIIQFKLIIRLRKTDIVDYVLKYGTGNLIIIYCYIYSRLLNITENVVWNFMKLIRGMLQLKDLRVGQWIEPCIGLTQENSWSMLAISTLF